MIENSAELALATDTDGRIVYANPASLRLTGFTEKQMLVSSFDEIFDLSDEQHRQVSQCLTKKQSAGFETSARRKDGTLFPVRLGISPLETGAKTGGLVLIGTDITEHKQAEEEHERLQQEIIEAQRSALEQLSTPIIPVMDAPGGSGSILVMPLIGSIDSTRALDITRSLLAGISQYRAKVVIVDITGVPIVDTGVANHLYKTLQAARLKGAQTIITGITEAVAETIVDLGIDWSKVTTLSDLQTGLIYALESLGLKVEEIK
jgi:rsbT co-antagonist protein RsbR